MGLSRKQLIIPLVAVLGVGAGFVTSVAASSGARPSPGGDPAVPLVAHLKGGNEEVPNAGDPDGFGFAILNLSPVQGEVCFEVTTSNIGAWIAAHIHTGGVGTPGGVFVNFAVGAGTETGPELTKCVTAPADDIQAIIDDPAAYYVNVHTADFPGGAVRGQIVARSSETQFHPTPVRVYDSRSLPAGKIAINETRTIDLQLPAGVRAGIVTVTVDVTEGGGFLTAYAAGLTLPATSTVNWTQPNSAVATTTYVAVNANGQISVTAGQNATHFIIDVIGFVI